jgi:hypothetical protein
LLSIVAIVVVVAIIGFLTTRPVSVAAAGQGACVIIPNQQAAVETAGKGLVNADHVCDAAVNGCGFCMAQCELFPKIVDKYGCGERVPSELTAVCPSTISIEEPTQGFEFYVCPTLAADDPAWISACGQVLGGSGFVRQKVDPVMNAEPAAVCANPADASTTNAGLNLPPELVPSGYDGAAVYSTIPGFNCVEGIGLRSDGTSLGESDVTIVCYP